MCSPNPDLSLETGTCIRNYVLDILSWWFNISDIISSKLYPWPCPAQTWFTQSINFPSWRQNYPFSSQTKNLKNNYNFSLALIFWIESVRKSSWVYPQTYQVFDYFSSASMLHYIIYLPWITEIASILSIFTLSPIHSQYRSQSNIFTRAILLFWSKMVLHLGFTSQTSVKKPANACDMASLTSSIVLPFIHSSHGPDFLLLPQTRQATPLLGLWHCLFH